MENLPDDAVSLLLDKDMRYYTAVGASSLAGGATLLFDGGITAAVAVVLVVGAAALGYPQEPHAPVTLFLNSEADEGVLSLFGPLEPGSKASWEFFEHWTNDPAYNDGNNIVSIAFGENVKFLASVALVGEPQGSVTWANLVFCVNDAICVSMYTGDPQAAKEEKLLGDIQNLRHEMEINPPGNTALMEHTIIGCLAPHPSTHPEWTGPTVAKPSVCAIGDVPEIEEERMIPVKGALTCAFVNGESVESDDEACKFIDALEEGGCGLFLGPIRFYSPDKPSNFWEITGAARMMSQVAVGYMKDGQVTVNPPDKNTAIIWAEGDYILVVDMVD